MGGISDSSKLIDEITCTVEGVAFQTNILALNAAVEAAREINEAVSQMDSITQQNAAMVEELAAAAVQLNQQVEEVDNSMRLFRLAQGDRTVAEAGAVEMRRSAREPKAAARPAAAPARARAAAPAHARAPALQAEPAWEAI